MELINKLVDDVEQVILDLQELSLTNPEGNHSACVPIQPLRNWKNQGAVLDFKSLLKTRFRKTIENNLTKQEINV